jgi:epoxide hydrolase
MLVRPFSIDVSQELLDELYVRLARIKWPSEATIAVLADGGTGPPGLPVDWLRRLMERWLGGFDWPTQQARLNRLPLVQVQFGGQFVHAVHLRGRRPSPMPLLLCHGWPSSFAEFTEMVPRLTDPVAFGGDPDDALSVVAPSLPGFIFSTPLPAGHSTDVVDLFADLMRQLGYETFGVHSVDLGSFVAHRLALDHPNRIRGLHTTYPAESPGVDNQRWQWRNSCPSGLSGWRPAADTRTCSGPGL